MDNLIYGALWYFKKFILFTDSHDGKKEQFNLVENIGAIYFFTNWKENSLHRTDAISLTMIIRNTIKYNILIVITHRLLEY